MSQLGDTLFTNTQQQILGLLYGQPARSFYMNEILRVTGMGVATVKRELDRMLSAGILTMQPLGNQHHYQANSDCPVYEELLSIVGKTLGVTQVLRAALLPLAGSVRLAFVYGSVASGKESAASDVDLLVVGDMKYAQLVKALYPVQETLGREINPRLYSPEEWKNKRAGNDGFITQVMEQPRLVITGDKDDSGQSGGQKPGAHYP